MLALASACVYRGESVDLSGQDVRVTFLHTADWHSRLFPYNLQIGHIDSGLGLGEVGNIADVGGGKNRVAGRKPRDAKHRACQNGSSRS